MLPRLDAMIRSLSRLFAVPNKFALLGLVRGMSGQVSLMCASALLRCGAMAQLGRWRSLEDVAVAADVSERALLRNLLELGVRRRLLRRRGERYVARSALGRALARDPEGPIASMLLEITSYHQEVMRDLPARLRGERPRDHLARYGTLVARSSRIADPWLFDWVRRLLGANGSRTVLDLGCGSGSVLSFVAGLDAAHRGLGLELDAEVAAQANERLASAGHADRFEVRVGDMRRGSTWPDGAFDVVTAHQNVYYFDADERVEIFRAARARLAPAGTFAIATATAGGPMADYFDLILGSTEGCRPLPSVADLEGELGGAGLVVARRERLIPGDSVFGLAAVVASADGSSASA